MVVRPTDTRHAITVCVPQFASTPSETLAVAASKFLTFTNGGPSTHSLTPSVQLLRHKNSRSHRTIIPPSSHPFDK